MAQSLTNGTESGRIALPWQKNYLSDATVHELFVSSAAANADQIALVAGVSSNERRDILLSIGIEDLSEGEEILLADAQGKSAAMGADGCVNRSAVPVLRIRQVRSSEPVFRREVYGRGACDRVGGN